MELNFATNLIAAALVGVGYALLYNVSKRIFIPAIGGTVLTWLVYTLMIQQGQTPILAAFSGAVAVSIWAEVCSRINKTPVTVFLILGVLPLVPGSGIYYTMQAIVNGNSALATERGIETLGIALALALGILIVSTLVRLLYLLLGRDFQLPRRV